MAKSAKGYRGSGGLRGAASGTPAAVGGAAIKGNKVGSSGANARARGPVPGTRAGQGGSAALFGGNPSGAGARKISGSSAGSSRSAGAGRRDGGPSKQTIGNPAKGIGLTGNH